MGKYKNIFVVGTVVLILFLLSKLPLSDYLNSLTEWFRGFGLWAPVMYFIFFTLTSSWMFPVFMLSIASGILFGVYQGVLIVSLANLASCTIMFLIARYKGRDWFESKLNKYPKIKGFGQAIEKEGWKMLFMLRAVPIVHMILLNLTCGLSKVRLKDYMFGTWLGMLPLLVFYVYMGSLTDSIVTTPQAFQFGGANNYIVIGLALFMLFAFSIYMKKVMKKYIIPVTV